MFGSNKTKEDSKSTGTTSTPASSTGLNSLVKGTYVEGNMKADNDIRVDGTIKGNLHCKAKVIIGPSGFIDGEVKCANAVIEGKFHGSMQVSELLSIRETAEVIGDIRTKKLIVQAGAVFNVACKMETEIINNTVAKTEKDTKPLVTTAKP